MSWLAAFAPKKKVLCFVDDDRDELSRFEKAMSTQPFECVTGTTHDECIDKLKRKNLTPDLWVLDLYFPEQVRTNSPDELKEMADKYAQLEQHARDFRGYLRTIGQGPDGGLDLLQKCRPPDRGALLPWGNYHAPVVMLTRKDNLDDALTCQDRGAVGVLKKPMPANLRGGPEDRKVQMDEAKIANAYYLAGKFSDAIKRNGFLYKHRGTVGAVAGAVVGWLLRIIAG